MAPLPLLEAVESYARYLRWVREGLADPEDRADIDRAMSAALSIPGGWNHGDVLDIQAIAQRLQLRFTDIPRGDVPADYDEVEALVSSPWFTAKKEALLAERGGRPKAIATALAKAAKLSPAPPCPVPPIALFYR